MRALPARSLNSCIHNGFAEQTGGCQWCENCRPERLCP